MPKNSLNSWVGTTMQPQFQTYQTAGMLQPAQPPQLPPAPPPTPAPAPAPQTGSGVQIFTPPPVGAPAFPPPITTQPQPASPLTGQQPTTGIAERDRLIDALVGKQILEQ